MKKISILILLTFINNFLPGASFTDKEIADQIVKSLEENYDKKECDSAFEKLLMDINKKSYLKLLNGWKKFYYDITLVQFDNEPVLNEITNILEKNTDNRKVEEFKKLIYELKFICLENIKLYFNAVQENALPENIEEIDCNFIDHCMLNFKYYNLQKNLYNREFYIKDNIKRILSDKRVKIRLGFYIFIFELAAKQREKTVKRLLDNYLVQLNK
ncbi:MAG: hypothetical protein JXB50_16030 [Spirochaetes bacterium]|nr:hypothetical protein [Spirochaetota bacterium]